MTNYHALVGLKVWDVEEEEGEGCILCPSTAIHQGILESEVELASNREKNGKAEQKREKIFQ